MTELADTIRSALDWLDECNSPYIRAATNYSKEAKTKPIGFTEGMYRVEGDASPPLYKLVARNRKNAGEVAAACDFTAQMQHELMERLKLDENHDGVSFQPGDHAVDENHAIDKIRLGGSHIVEIEKTLTSNISKIRMIEDYIGWYCRAKNHNDDKQIPIKSGRLVAEVLYFAAFAPIVGAKEVLQNPVVVSFLDKLLCEGETIIPEEMLESLRAIPDRQFVQCCAPVFDPDQSDEFPSALIFTIWCPSVGGAGNDAQMAEGEALQKARESALLANTLRAGARISQACRQTAPVQDEGRWYFGTKANAAAALFSLAVDELWSAADLQKWEDGHATAAKRNAIFKDTLVRWIASRQPGLPVGEAKNVCDFILDQVVAVEGVWGREQRLRFLEKARSAIAG